MSILTITRKKQISLAGGILFIWLVIYPDSGCYAIMGGGDLREIEEANVQKQFVEPVVIERPAAGYTSDSLRDPFKPYLQREEKGAPSGESPGEEIPPDLVVQGIIWGSSLPQAIINNTVVKVGDMIEEARILEISKEGVTVFFKNRQYKLGSPGLSPGVNSS